MSQTGCIITGCQLRLEGSTHAVAGDLYLQGDRFIFNGNMDTVTRGALWVPKEELGHYSKVITIPVGYDYFERRGLFVMKANRELLNEAANKYTSMEIIRA